MGSRTIGLMFCAMAALAYASDTAAIVAAANDHFYNLEYDQAIAGYTLEIESQPTNPEAYNHLANAILYREMFRTGALESQLVSGSNPFLHREKVNPSPADQKQFDDAIGKAMQLAQAELDKDPRDVMALYSLGVSYGLRSNYTFLVRKAWLDSLRDITTGRKLHNKIIDIDPSFIDARFVQGVHDYVVGSLPFTWKLLGFLGGFHGDREEGISEVKLVSEKGRFAKVDAMVLLAAAYRREHRAKDALPLLDTLIHSYPRNYLLRFELSQMYADLGDEPKALEILQEIAHLREIKAPGYTSIALERLAYAEGNLHFWYRDFPQAATDLRKATAGIGALDLNTALMAWMRLGQTYDMLKDRKQAVTAYQDAINLAPQSEIAKECRNYTSRPYRRRDDE